MTPPGNPVGRNRTVCQRHLEVAEKQGTGACVVGCFTKLQYYEHTFLEIDMANISPNDVILIPWRSVGPPTVKITQAGDPNLPAAAALSGAIEIHFPTISALATVTVQGTPGDDVGFWRFGFIQLGFISNDWAHYRNPDPAEGSVFVARDRPPALRQQMCRDSVAETGIAGAFQRFPYLSPIIFYDPETPMNSWWGDRITGFLPMGTKIPAGGKLAFTILFDDSPSPHWWGLNRVNNTAMRINQLYSLQYGRAFATMFAVQKGPNQPIEVLKSFQWNVQWRAHFGRLAGVNVQLPARKGDVMDMHISHVVMGTPNDPRFQSRVLDITLPNCNAQLPQAFKNQVVRESKTHEDWKVTH
jgi:hypothetical protein